MSASLISHYVGDALCRIAVPSLPRPGRRAARIRKRGHKVKPVRSAPDRSNRFCPGSSAREYDRADRRSDPWFDQYRRGPPRRERLGQAVESTEDRRVRIVLREVKKRKFWTV